MNQAVSEGKESKGAHELNELYANHVRIDVNTYGFVLTFGLTRPPSGEIREHTLIHMSPQHAQSLNLLLQRFIALYNDNIAPIDLPADLVKQLTGTSSKEDGD